MVSAVPRKFGSRARSATPHTQFEVQVLDSLKGDVSGFIIIDQMGGYRPDGVLMLVNGRAPVSPGATYVLAAKYSPPSGWYTILISGGAIRLPDPADEDAQMDREIRVAEWRDAVADETRPHRRPAPPPPTG